MLPKQQDGIIAGLMRDVKDLTARVEKLEAAASAPALEKSAPERADRPPAKNA